MSQILLAAYGAPVFDPTSIPGLQLWLKADSLVLSDGDPVGTWDDQSGNANDATATSTERPTYKVNIINGLPVVRFDASNVNRLAFTTAPATTTTLVVGQINVGPGSLSTYAPFIIYGTSGAGRLCARTSSTNWGTFLGFPAAADLDSGENLSASTPVLLEMTSSTVSGTVLYRSGVQKASDGSSASSNGPASFVGAEPGSSRFLDGDIGEILTYDSVLSGGNLGLLETYLFDRWGV